MPRPDDVRRAVYLLRDAGFDNISLDLIYGIPGQSPAELSSDLAEALALEPEHISAYELEAKPGTRFTHAHGAELARQAESMESYFELVVETLTRAGYRWYETANFCRTVDAGWAHREPGASRGRATCGHSTTSATGSGTTTSVWAWALSRQSRIVAGETPRRFAATSKPSRRVGARLASSRSCPTAFARRSGSCSDCGSTSPSSSSRAAQMLDPAGLERLERLGLVRGAVTRVALTARGRFLGDDVTATLLA